MSQFRKSLFSSFLILLFASYVVNLAVFTHIHYVNGVVFTHSHPHSNHGTHSHSCPECSALSSFSLFFSFDPVVTTVEVQQDYILHTYNSSYTAPLVQAELFKVPDLRAPPSCIL